MGWRVRDDDGFAINPDFEKWFIDSGWILRDVIIMMRPKPSPGNGVLSSV